MIARAQEVGDLCTEFDVCDIAARAFAEFRHALRMGEQEKIRARQGPFFLVDEIAASHADDNTEHKQVSRPSHHRFLPHIYVAARCAADC